MTRMMCGERLADRVSTDVLHDSVGEVMEVEITWKRRKGRPRKSWEVCKEGFGTIWLEEGGCVLSKEMARVN